MFERQLVVKQSLKHSVCINGFTAELLSKTCVVRMGNHLSHGLDFLVYLETKNCGREIVHSISENALSDRQVTNCLQCQFTMAGTPAGWCNTVITGVITNTVYYLWQFHKKRSALKLLDIQCSLCLPTFAG